MIGKHDRECDHKYDQKKMTRNMIRKISGTLSELGFRIGMKLQEGFTGEDEETRDEEDDAPAEAPAAAALACPFAGTAVGGTLGIGGTLVLSTTW